MANSKKTTKKVAKKKTRSLSTEQKALLLDRHTQALVVAANKLRPKRKVTTVQLKKKHSLDKEIAKFNKAIQAIPGMKGHSFFRFDDQDEMPCQHGYKWCHVDGTWSCVPIDQCPQ